MLQQFSGINGVLYFSSLTFQDVGVRSSALASLFVGLTNFAGLQSGQQFYACIKLKISFLESDFDCHGCYLSPGALCALYLIDRQGRQNLLSGSYLGMVSFMICLHIISLLSNTHAHMYA